MRKKLIGSNKALLEAPIHYKGKTIGRIVGVCVIKREIIVEVILTNCYKCGTKIKQVEGIGQFCPNKKCDVLDGVGLFNLLEVY